MRGLLRGISIFHKGSSDSGSKSRKVLQGGVSDITAVFKSLGKTQKKVDFRKGPQESMAGSAC